MTSGSARTDAAAEPEGLSTSDTSGVEAVGPIRDEIERRARGLLEDLGAPTA